MPGPLVAVMAVALVVALALTVAAFSFARQAEQPVQRQSISQATGYNTFMHKRYGILTDNSHIFYIVAFQRHQQVPNTRFVYFNSNKVLIGLALSHFPG